MSDAQPVAVITGASRGLGRGIALQLAGQGLSLVINYAGNVDAAEATVAACKAQQTQPGQEFLPLQANVARQEDRLRLVEQTLARLGRIDVLVNNAGVGPSVRADLTDTTIESFEQVLQVNLEGPFFLTQAVARYWLNNRPMPILPHGFVVVNVSSISANTASLNRGEYCVSKAGLAMVTQLWALRLAESAVNVYELRPGIMATDMTAGVKDKYDRLLGDGLVPQHRWGKPEDVGKAVGMLVRGDLPYSTGEVIFLDGGMRMRRF
ncbi:MAG: 3-ketoacyl-ACP reductase [Bacteroidetes bacterium]|nr:3-ketoacyl-ACP reductase [Bacteroidota bacterium]